MNKKIVAISVLLLMMCAFAVSVFADDGKYQYEYAVTMTLRSTSSRATKSVTEKVWASTQSEAMELAKSTCDWKYPGYEVTSCGYPQATGNKRER
jgi:hypothetical protein